MRGRIQARRAAARSPRRQGRSAGAVQGGVKRRR